VWYGPGYPRPDTESPGGRITSPTHLWATNSSPLTISAEAWDDASGVDRVEFYAWYCHASVCEWRQLGTAYSAPYSFTWDWTELGDKHVWLSLDVVDRTGKRTGSAGGWVEVDLDRSTPQVDALLPAPDSYINSTPIRISAQVTDSGTGVAQAQFFAGYAGQGDYWHEIGVDTNGGDGWSADWDGAAVVDQVGVSFYVYVYDHAGNYRGAASYNHSLDRQAPQASLYSLNSRSPAEFLVLWSGTDATSGVQSYDLDYQDNGGTWQAWLRDVGSTEATFSGQAGHTYGFRVRGRDQAGNQGSWPIGTQMTTTAVNCAQYSCITVLTRAGERAFGGARVEVFASATGYPLAQAYVDLGGNWVGEFPPGNYTVVVENAGEHSLVVDNNVALPGAVIVSAQSTVRHTLSLANGAGQPALGYFNAVPTHMRNVRGYIGATTGAGTLEVYLSPGTYHFLGTSYGDALILVKSQTTVMGDGQTRLHANELPVARVTVHTSGYSNNSTLVFWPADLHWYSAWFSNPVSGRTYTISAGIRVVKHFYGAATTAAGEQWEYDLTLCSAIETLGFAQTVECSVNNQITVFATPTKEVYWRGELFQQTTSITDGFGNVLWRTTRTNNLVALAGAYEMVAPITPDAYAVLASDLATPLSVGNGESLGTTTELYPTTRLWDSTGQEINNQSGGANYYAYSYVLPIEAVAGQFRTTTSLDTGPLAGLISHEVQFVVSDRVLWPVYIPFVKK